jgi:hypothetical protein
MILRRRRYNASLPIYRERPRPAGSDVDAQYVDTLSPSAIGVAVPKYSILRRPPATGLLTMF